MADKEQVLPEYIPTKGVLYFEESSQMVLCKPRIMPLKSATLERMEQIQKEAADAVKDQMKNDSQQTF